MPYTSSLRPLALGSARISNCHDQTQARFSSSSGIATLTPPWQFEDLTRPERRAFERWGPNYWSHMNPEQKKLAEQMAEKRAQTAARLEKEFGSDWYAIMKQATAIKDQQELAQEKERLGDSKEYRKQDTKEKKAARRQFFEEAKATKADRLHEAMREVVQNRARF
ncbi:hypothetical protein N0V82_007558 [Gnomoniopsis sp. IMI 355080]|nr:hypothetical protein N0V82_007558 [Gnomoniopsis sp. IMI 355080]